MLASLRNRFLKFFGDIKVFKYPLFMLYDPGSYKVKGHEVRRVLDTLQPGDILIRGYSNYLDGFFIPGFFSHAGLYLGETHKSDLLLPDVLADKFYQGKQVVMHAMAEGVFMEDLITFCKCDYLVVLRRSTATEPDTDIKQSFQTVYQHALKHLGKGYDFKFDFSDIGNLSCTEFVFVCNDSFLPLYHVRLKERRVLFRKRLLLIPDDFITEQFDIVFRSQSVSEQTIQKIIHQNNQSYG